MLDQIAGVFGGFSLLQQSVAVIALILIVLLYIAIRVRRRAGAHRMPVPKARQPRLAVMESAIVDEKRRLMLIRRDEVEHLVLMGGPTDVVIESNIGKSEPVAADVRVEPLTAQISPAHVKVAEPAVSKPAIGKPVEVAEPPVAAAAIASSDQDKDFAVPGMARSPEASHLSQPADVPSPGPKPLQAGFNPAVRSEPRTNGGEPSVGDSIDTPLVAKPPRAPEPQVRPVSEAAQRPSTASVAAPTNADKAASVPAQNGPRLSQPSGAPSPAEPAKLAAKGPEHIDDTHGIGAAKNVAGEKPFEERATAGKEPIVGPASQPRWNAPSYRDAPPVKTAPSHAGSSTQTPKKIDETTAPGAKSASASIDSVDDDIAIGLEEAIAAETGNFSRSPAPTHDQFSRTLSAQGRTVQGPSAIPPAAQKEKSLEDEMALLIGDIGDQQTR